MSKNTNNLPDTFAGGRFGLPMVIAKMVRLADRTEEPERTAVIHKLWSKGYFLDKAGVVWDKDNVPSYVRQHDARYAELSGVRG